MNGFSVQQVTTALTKAREAFIAANLDRQVVQDNKIEPFVKLFAPDMQDKLRTDPAHRVRIAPGFRLLDVPVKVNGQLTIEPGKKGELVIRANYSIAYAFHIDNTDEIQDVMDIVAVSRLDQRYVFRDGPGFAVSSRGLWPAESHGYTFSMNCSKFKEEGLLAPAYSGRSFVPGVPGMAEENRRRMFDPNAPMPVSSTC